MTIEKFIGSELRRKYDDIWPIVRLVLYHLDTTGKVGIMGLDGEWREQGSFRSKLVCPIRFIAYQWHRLFSVQKPGPSIYLSNSMLRIDRYTGLLEELYENYNIISPFSWSDINRETFLKKNDLQKKIYQSRQLYFGKSVSGQCVKTHVERIYDLFFELLSKNEVCNDRYEYVDRSLQMLQSAVNERIDEIVPRLKERQVSCFITINERNIQDVLIILACRRAGIWTKELSHQQNCMFNLVRYDDKRFFDDNAKMYSATHESCQWSEPDKEFCIKYNVFDAVYNDFRISVVGCPEVTEKEYLINNKKYTKEDAMVIFVPSVSYFMERRNKEAFGISQGAMQRVLGATEIIYNQVAKIAKERQMKVYIRYHPHEPIAIIEAEKELVDALGFESLTTREDFVKAVCSCKVAIGYITSAFDSVLLYGGKCYALILGEKEQYDFCGLGVQRIRPNEILNITLENCNEDGVVHSIDINQLCTYPQI